MTKEEYNAIVGMVELLGYQYCERNKIRFGTKTEFTRGLDEALNVIKKFIECPHYHVVIDRKDNIVDLDKVWHKYNSKQEICGDIIARYKDNILVGVHSQCDIDIFLRDNKHLEGKVYFSFVKDLLPKGDSK